MAGRSGAALFEAIVAMALIGMLAAIGHATLETVGTGHSLVSRETRARETTIHADDVLSELLIRSRTGAPPLSRFRGSPVEVAFGSSCLTAAGWDEPCSVRFTLSDRGDSSELAIATDARAPVVLRRYGSPARFVFVLDAVGGGVVSPAWGDRIVAPIALMIEAPGTRRIYRVGAPQ